ncbi:NAD-dependent epimerase/dehydratase family protein [Nakamurella deserti]|uniref:NAD-dependent epimerase/dehydratase family protein n=1 Tax=Nakamurella deserti TaxID=2164074 RepID=UPI000DBE901A|nr:NAD-dependent epimerase/dehydratase family protein [Nakamurella deserti]
MRILLTGATGLMGRLTAERLLARGDDVTVLQRRPAGLDTREILGDVTDAHLVAEACRRQDVVLHLAAKVDAFGAWPDFERVNVGGTAAILAGCRSAGVPRLVNVSSPSVAHAGDDLVGVGASPADPHAARSHYSRSKAMAERAALAANGPDLAVLSIRPHLVWGPGDTQLIARIVERARSGRLPLIGNGAALIDATYVDNAADAMVAAVDAVGRVHGEALVVSNGEPRPVGEVLRRICAAAGVPGPRGRVPARLATAAGAVVEKLWRIDGFASEPPLTRFLAEQLSTAHWFDQRRTREALNWTPAVGMDEGFHRLAASYAAADG